MRKQNTDPAILLLSHGSHDPEALCEFVGFSKDFQKKFRYDNLIPVHVSSLLPMLKSLVESHITTIAVIPYFLFFGGHMSREVPGMLRQFQKKHPHVSLLYGRPLWPHRYFLDAATERIQNAVDSFTDCKNKSADVLVVGRGSSHPVALAQFYEALEQLREHVSCRHLHHCFTDLAHPLYTEKLPELLGNGTKDLVIFPFYLFKGVLVKRTEQQAVAAAKSFDASVKLAAPFGAHPLMFELLHERIMEMAEGITNGDTHLSLTALRGFYDTHS